MPVNWLTEAERIRLNRFPAEIPEADLITFFTLSAADRELVGKCSGAPSRLGFAFQLCAFRYLGCVPEELASAPAGVITFLARQLDVEADLLAAYGQRTQTRSDHLREIQTCRGFRKVGEQDWNELERWLVERALEHDRPLLLLHLLCERLQSAKLLRPGVTVLERAVSTARQRAQEETWRIVSPLLDAERKAALDRLLEIDEQKQRTLLTWLRTSATSFSPGSILDVLEKITEIRALGVAEWDLRELNPNRLKLLAQIGRKSTNQALLRFAPERRYPILIAFLFQSLEETIDEAIDLYDRCLAEAYARAGRDLTEFRRTVAKATNEKVRLFQAVGRILLDPAVRDSEIRELIYQQIAPEALRVAVDECDRIVRPLDDSYFDLLGTRYSHLRQFAPRFLETFAWHAGRADDPLLNAITVLRELNAEGLRKVPDEAPREFIPAKWEPYVITESGQLHRRYYELCLLWEMRGALRAGDLWVEGSRRFNNPESYLIAPERWPDLRTEACRLMKAPENGDERLKQRTLEFHELARRLDQQLAGNGPVRLEDGELVVGPLAAEDRPAGSVELEELVAERLPRVDLPTLLIEVDSWVNFTKAFTHAGGSESRTRDQLPAIYASLLAQSGNFGLTLMAQMSGLTYRQLAWTTTWYLREETLRGANTRMVNYHYHLPLSQSWGGGTLSSSDGQRFPVSVRTANATALPRYFGYGRGLTFYTWTSDQHSQFGTKVIPSTLRDATVVLDEILDNETELPLFEHATDTADFTEVVFGLFDLLGLQFAPRIRDLGDQQLSRPDRQADYPHLCQLLKGAIRQELILTRWDDLLHLAGSLKLGWVTASLLIGKMQAKPRQNALTKALQEYGRLVKTNFILRYLSSEEYRRRINLQLNKGEALHALRRYLFVAHEGQIRRRHPEAQLNQASCLNLVTNAVIVWNTVYMTAVLEQLRQERHQFDEGDVRRLSPTRHEHLNIFGKYSFPVSEEFNRKQLRPLRHPGEDH